MRHILYVSHTERERNDNMPDCIIAMKTRTAAERARRAAALERIDTQIVSIDPSVTGHGCSVGLRLGCGDVDRTVALLDKRSISYGDVIGRSGK